MNHNLTPLQRDGLKWIVDQVRADKLEESFLIVWVLTGAIIADCEIENIPEEILTQGNLAAWDQARLVITRQADQYSIWCTLTQSAFEAADSNFADPEDQPNPVRLLAFLSENYKLDELHTIAFRLGIDPENIEGKTKPAYARELIAHGKNRGRLWDLVHIALQMD